jgi:multiple sugar transport system ATP-binding protein
MKLRREIGGTMVLVTHEQEDALVLGDRVGLMMQGKLLSAGSPIEMYERPLSLVVAALLGSPVMNVFRCDVTRTDEQSTARIKMDDGDEGLAVTLPSGEWEELVARRSVCLGIRAESVSWADESAVASTSAICWLPGNFEVTRNEYIGYETITTLSVGRMAIKARGSGRTRVVPGARCRVGFRIDEAVWFDRNSGAALRT